MEQNCGKCCIRPIQPHVLNKCHQNVRIDGNRCARNSYDTPEKLSAPNWSGWGNVCVCVCVHAVCGVVAPAFFPFFHSFCFFILFSGFVFVSNLFYGGEYISKYLSMLLLILCGIFSHEWLPLLFLIMRIIILHHSSRKCAAHAYNCTLLWRNMEYGTV